MPNYSFENTKTGEEFNLTMTNAEREKYLQDNPEIHQIFNKFPGVCDSVRIGVKHADSGFRNQLQRIKKNNKGSKIDSGNLTEY